LGAIPAPFFSSRQPDYCYQPNERERWGHAMGLFGRKKSTPPPGASGDAGEDDKTHPGHQAVLRHLAEKEGEDPGIRERLAGTVLFDLAYQLLQDDRGVRIENLLAMLASVGGQQCIAPIIAGAPKGTMMEQLGLMVVQGNDGRVYLFGDPPNRLLIESQDSLLSLAFGAAQALGAPVTMDMIVAEMKTVASRVGGSEFEALDLPAEHSVDRPTEWARVFTPKIVEALDLYDVPPMRRATAIGYALQKAIDAGKANIEPLLSAKIVLQCATRTSKLLLG
jgi:hypothetical protein